MIRAAVKPAGTSMRRRHMTWIAVAALGLGLSATSDADSRAGSGTRAVAIEDFEYTPQRIVVARGTRIRWTNRDDANHTVTFARRASLDNIRKHTSGTLRFGKPGRYRYVCAFHPGMRGVVVVRR